MAIKHETRQKEKMMKLKQILFEEEIDDGRKVIEKKDIRKELDNVGANKFKVIKQGKGSAISLEQSFEDFKQTMKFINDVAKIQTKLDHHGDISFNYDTVKLEIYSHTHNTITTVDIEFAKLVADKLPKEK